MSKTLLGLFLALFLPRFSLYAMAAPEETLSISQRTAGLQRHDGFIPYFWDAHKGAVLLEISRGMGEFLYGSGLASGSGMIETFLDRGQPGSLGLCRFERVGPKVLLVQKQTTNRSGDPEPERTRVVEESFPTSILAAMPVVAEEGDRTLVDATDFLLRDTEVLSILRQARSGRLEAGRRPLRAQFRPDRRLSEEQRDRSRPLVRLRKPRAGRSRGSARRPHDEPSHPSLVRSAAGARVSARVSRSADRILSLSSIATRRRRFAADRAVSRDALAARRLASDRLLPRPRYTGAGARRGSRSRALVEPRVRGGGVSGRPSSRGPAVGATFLDVRYSGVEWVNRAERGWSVGEIQIDPRTGEILHGVARIDSHRRRTTARIWQNLQPPAARLRGGRRSRLFVARGRRFEDGVDEETLVLDRLRYLAAHEVGHTLGLDHDWAATTFGWGSVMDYLAPDIELKNGKFDLSNAYPHDIGSLRPSRDSMGLFGSTTRRRSTRSFATAIRRESSIRSRAIRAGPSTTTGAIRSSGSRRLRRSAARFSSASARTSSFPASRCTICRNDFRSPTSTTGSGFGPRSSSSAASFRPTPLAGDGQKPVAWVSPTQQRERSSSCLCRSRSGQSRHSRFDSRGARRTSSGGTADARAFSLARRRHVQPLMSARTSPRSSSEPLTEAQRDARLTLDREPGAPRLEEVLKILAATWGAPAENGPAGGPVPGRARVGARRDSASRREPESLAGGSRRSGACFDRLRRRSRPALRSGGKAFRELARRDLDGSSKPGDAKDSPPAREGSAREADRKSTRVASGVRAAGSRRPRRRPRARGGRKATGRRSRSRPSRRRAGPRLPHAPENRSSPYSSPAALRASVTPSEKRTSDSPAASVSESFGQVMPSLMPSGYAPTPIEARSSPSGRTRAGPGAPRRWR